MVRRGLETMALGLAVVAVLVCASGCDLEEAIGSQVQSQVVRTQAFAAGGALSLDALSANGAIRVRMVEGQSDVQVQMTLRSRGRTLEEANDRVSRIVVHAAKEGDQVVLRYDASDQAVDVRRSSGVEFDVTLPGAAGVRARTSNGAIRVSGVEGALDLETSNGEIVIEQYDGPVAASTSNGQVLVRGGEGTLDLRTSNGRIRIEDVTATVRAETSNGEIAFSGRLADGDHRLRSSNGHINVRLPMETSVRVLARTANATIASSLPLVGDVDGRSWDAALNPPCRATLTIETSNAAIDLGALP